jgi:asparagine synthase (glutamine-hydrolysing)
MDPVTGMQPILNEDQTIMLVCNGEIYNHEELRTRLESAGHQFVTRSDIEVIIHGYEEWGTDIARHLSGMFAFAIYDSNTHELILSRDRLGKKPLYFSIINRGQANERLIFGSEMQCLLADSELDRSVDTQALEYYLTYEFAPEDQCLLQHVQKVQPSETVTYSRRVIRRSSYWELRYDPKVEIDEMQAAEQTREMLKSSVQKRLFSHAKLGFLVSSGLDSSSVATMASTLMTAPLKTFCAAQANADGSYFKSELDAARLLSSTIGSEHYEILISPQPEKILGSLVWHYGEPNGELSAIPFWEMYCQISREVRVLIAGDGGDESFGGYTRYFQIRSIGRQRKRPAIYRMLLQPLIAAAASIYSNSAELEKLHNINRCSLLSDDFAFAHKTMIFEQLQRKRLLAHGNGSFQPEQLIYGMMNGSAPAARLDRRLRSDVLVHMPGVIFPKSDRLGMAHGLEVRCPYFDHEFLSAVAKFPAEFKATATESKRLLRRTMGSMLPGGYLDNPKTGFGEANWDLFSGGMRELTNNLLFDGTLEKRGYFNMHYVRQLCRQHIEKKRSHRHRLWLLIVFEAWCRTFLDRSDISAGPLSFV